MLRKVRLLQRLQKENAIVSELNYSDPAKWPFFFFFFSDNLRQPMVHVP